MVNTLEVLTRDCGSKRWVRDPENSIPLIVIQEEGGRIFVRAQVRHFSVSTLWKDEKEVDLGFQRYPIKAIPHRQRQGNKSVVKNETDGVDIKVYVWRCAQWNAAVEAVKLGGGVNEVQASMEFVGNVRKEKTSAARLPQGTTIRPGESHFVEIPHAGSIFSPRKATVSIVTESHTDEDGYSTRLETQLMLRARMMLTVTLPVGADGNVVGHPIASDSGGVLHQIMRLIQNEVNSEPRSLRSPGTNTEAMSSIETTRPVDEDANASEMSEEGESDADRTSPATNDTDRDGSTPSMRMSQPKGIGEVGLFMLFGGCVGAGIAFFLVLLTFVTERY